LTVQSKSALQKQAQSLKNDGNSTFSSKNFIEAIKLYSEALDICPLSFPLDRIILFSNCAECCLKMENYNEAISYTTQAITIAIKNQKEYKQHYKKKQFGEEHELMKN